MRKKADLAQRQMKNHCGRFDQKRERRSEERGEGERESFGHRAKSNPFLPFSSLFFPFALSLPRLFFPFFLFFSSPVAWPLSSLIVGVRTQFEIRPNVERQFFPRYFPVKILFTLFQTVCGVRRGYSHLAFFFSPCMQSGIYPTWKREGRGRKAGETMEKREETLFPPWIRWDRGEKGGGEGEEGAPPLSALSFSAGGCARKGVRGSLFFLAQLIPIPRPILAREESFGKRKLVHVSAYTAKKR